RLKTGATRQRQATSRPPPAKRCERPRHVKVTESHVKGMPKNSPGNFFEEFRVGKALRHATPRTRNTGDDAPQTGLVGPVRSAEPLVVFGRGTGTPRWRLAV